MPGGTGGVLVRIGLPNRNHGADVRVIVRPIPPLAMASATRMNGEAMDEILCAREVVGRRGGMDSAG